MYTKRVLGVGLDEASGRKAVDALGFSRSSHLQVTATGSSPVPITTAMAVILTTVLLRMGLIMMTVLVPFARSCHC